MTYKRQHLGETEEIDIQVISTPHVNLRTTSVGRRRWMPPTAEEDLLQPDQSEGQQCHALPFCPAFDMRSVHPGGVMIHVTVPFSTSRQDGRYVSGHRMID